MLSITRVVVYPDNYPEAQLGYIGNIPHVVVNQCSGEFQYHSIAKTQARLARV